MRSIGGVLTSAIFALSFVSTPALAQATQPANPGAASQDCQAAPSNNGSDGQAGQQEGKAPSADLSAKLDKCNGVLAPPPTGDTEIREAPPASGKTPIIKPGTLPEQPPSQG